METAIRVILRLLDFIMLVLKTRHAFGPKTKLDKVKLTGDAMYKDA